MPKEHLKSFFSFSKKELNGLLVFCILLILIVLLPFIYQWFRPVEVFQFDQFKSEIAAFRVQLEKQNEHNYQKFDEESKKERLKPSYFVFNPNNLSVDKWKRLGLTARQIKVIKNYESKGGRFYRKEDLKKIYSISASEYEKLEPFINIPESNSSSIQSFSKLYNKPERVLREIVVIEINSADSALLETLNGIGPVFASRIIKYRNRLGGFYMKEQLKEVFGIDSAKYEELKEQVKIDPSLIEKININTASFEDFRKHPYLRYNQINAILQYRRQHGNYNNINDVRKINIIDEENFRKIEPYLNL